MKADTTLAEDWLWKERQTNFNYSHSRNSMTHNHFPIESLNLFVFLRTQTSVIFHLEMCHLQHTAQWIRNINLDFPLPSRRCKMWINSRKMENYGIFYYSSSGVCLCRFLFHLRISSIRMQKGERFLCLRIDKFGASALVSSADSNHDSLPLSLPSLLSLLA